MENLKSFYLILLLLGAVSFAYAQSDATLQAAFASSYASESKSNFYDAISTMQAVETSSNYEVNLRLGWLYYSVMNYKESLAHYQTAARLHPYAIEAKFGVVKPAAALYMWEEVQQQYDEVLKISPQNSYANYWRGMIDYNNKSYETAIKYFEKVITMYPTDYNANLMAGWSYLWLAKSEEAKTCFNRVLIYNRFDDSALDGMARLEYRSKLTGK